eukprot:1149698-Pelagomonas_calceolata.AAC.2
MYASQTWATPFLGQGTHREMDNLLHRWIINVLRNLLGVKTTTPSLSTLQESGIEPFQFNWFRASMRFYNSLSATVYSSRRFSTRTSALAPELALVQQVQVGHHTACLRWMIWQIQIR